MEISSIGQRIKRRREELNLTQDDLARKLGYQSRSSINKIELGKQSLTQSRIKAFAIALGVTPTNLMGWEDEQSSEIKKQSLERFSSYAELLNQLNEQGQEEALKRIEELTELPKYRKEN